MIHESISSSPFQRVVPFIYSSKENQPLNQWAREAISKGDEKYKDVKPVIDNNSNAGTDNQRSIYIATEFLNKASPEFMENKKVSSDEDRLVKVGRSLVDLVDIADNEIDEEASKEELLKLGLMNIVEQCDVLSKGDLKVCRKKSLLNYKLC